MHPNIISESDTADRTVQTTLLMQQTKLLSDEILLIIIYANFIQLRRSNLLEKTNFTTQKYLTIYILSTNQFLKVQFQKFR